MVRIIVKNMQRSKKVNLFIVSTKPYKSYIFVNLQSILKKNKIFSMSFYSKFGSFVVYFLSRNFFFFKDKKKKLFFNFSFVINEFFFNRLKHFVFLYIKGIQYCWMTMFFLEGYHFRAFFYYIKSLKRYLILFKLGFFFDVLVVLPKSIKLYFKKRTFKLRGSNFFELYNISFYIRMLRNLLPFKVKGIIYDNFGLNKAEFEKQIFASYIKKGKKSKGGR